jgi:hypothetical protein
LRVFWVRGNDHIAFNRPNTWFVLGVRGSGKSSLLEHIGENYLNEGHGILDLFGSRDGEALAWLRSPHAKDKKILLVHGDNVDVECSFDTKNISKVTLADLNSYDITISASPLYSSPNDEFLHVNHLIDLVYKRLYWQRLIYMVVRESANLYYSRLRISESQLSAKAESVYLIREARHCGIALGLDTLKYTSVDIDIRTVVDFLIMKAQGVLGFPDDLQWLYGYFEPAMVRTMRTPYFILISKTGALGLGEFQEIEWHKRERENIVKAVGLKVEYGEEVDYGKSKGVFKTVNDEEHIKIVDSYISGNQSQGMIAEALGRSSATIFNQIREHDKAIARLGYCMRCRRMKGKYESEKASKI